MPHLAYIGDAEIGPGANIGAGTITANYDGRHKHRTKVGATRGIGSNNVLVAPVEVGDDAYTGAGAVVTQRRAARRARPRASRPAPSQAGPRSARDAPTTATTPDEPRGSSTQKKRLMLFAGQGNASSRHRDLRPASSVPLGAVVLSSFANGELYCRYGENVRGADVFVIQSHCPPINDRIFEQLIMIDAAKRASAKRITAVCPFYAYARQDRKAEGREPITARAARRPAHRGRLPTGS